MNVEAERHPNGDRRSIWRRGLFMLLFGVAFSVAQTLLMLIAVVQFVWLLLAREPNLRLVHFGRSLSVWLGEVARFLSCASEDMPFPFKGWPATDDAD